MLATNRLRVHHLGMARRKGIYCLEVGEWYGSLKEKTSVEPMLELLRQSPLRVPFIHRDIATEGELRFYLSKWVQGRHRAYPILYLAFHGSPGCINLNKENGRPTTIGTDDLFSHLEGKCKGRIVHFGACSVLDVHGKTMNRSLAQSGAAAISGFRSDVDWTQAAFLEMLYLSELQHNQFVRSGIHAVERRVNTTASKLGKSLRFRICVK